MAINSKFIEFATKTEFDKQLKAGNIPINSIVTIKDTKQLWVRGLFISDNNHTHDYLPISGGTLTGNLYVKNGTSGTYGPVLYVSSAADDAIFGSHKSGVLGAYLRICNGATKNIRFHNGTSETDIWHAGNSNIASIDWNARKFIVHGAAGISSVLDFQGDKSLKGYVGWNRGDDSVNLSNNVSNKKLQLTNDNKLLYDGKELEFKSHSHEEYAWKSLYNATKGFLIKTDIAESTSSMMMAIIELNTYGKTKTTINLQWYDYTASNKFYNLGGWYIGENMVVSAARVAGKVCVWVSRSGDYQSCSAKLWRTTSDKSGPNRVIEIVDSEKPTDYSDFKLKKVAIGDFLPLSGGEVTGTLKSSGQFIFESSETGSFKEAARFNLATSNLAGFVIGGARKTTEGCTGGAWFVARNQAAKFIISPDDSTDTVGLTLNKGGSAYWRNKVIYTADNSNLSSVDWTAAKLTGTSGLLSSVNSQLLTLHRTDSNSSNTIKFQGSTITKHLGFYNGILKVGDISDISQADEIWHDGNKANQIPNNATNLTTSDLNSIITPGFYYQDYTANATSARNYPVNLAGSLEIIKAAGLIQRYISYGSYNITYIRGYYNGSWTAWRTIYSSTNANLSTIDWSARSLNLYGNINHYIDSSKFLFRVTKETNGGAIQLYDINGARKSLFRGYAVDGVQLLLEAGGIQAAGEIFANTDKKVWHAGNSCLSTVDWVANGMLAQYYKVKGITVVNGGDGWNDFGADNRKATIISNSNPEILISSNRSTIWHSGNLTGIQTGHGHHTLYATDKRDVKPNTTGISATQKAIKPFFIGMSTIGLSSYGAYGDLLALDTYSDSSGGKMNAIVMTKNTDATEMFIGNSAFDSASWGTFYRVRHSGNSGTLSNDWSSNINKAVKLQLIHPDKVNERGTIAYETCANAPNGYAINFDLTQIPAGYRNIYFTNCETFRINNNNVWHAGNFTPSTKLNVSGGTLTGALHFKNLTWNNIGDDAALGDCNMAGCVGIKGLNMDGAGFQFYGSSGASRGKLFVGTDNILVFNNHTIYHSGNLTGNQTNHSHNELIGVNYTSTGPEKPNFFGSGKLRYQMLGEGTQASGSAKGGIPTQAYSDAIWLSAYGADVPTANVLLFGKYHPKVGFRQQRYDATSWGAYYEFWHTGNFNPDDKVNAAIRSNWNEKGVLSNVVGQLVWKHHGNGHTIFDASNSVTPSGGSCSNTNPSVAWSATYPTLMGFNGTNTYGVRVDSARNADLVAGLHVHSGRNNEANKIVRTDSSGYIQAGYINSSSGNENNNSNPDRVWGSNSTDGYLRTYRTSALSVDNSAKLGGIVAANLKPKVSLRDFTNGTLIRTSIDYSQTNGAAWYLKIHGNIYSNGTTLNLQAQGYIYNNTIINTNAIYFGTFVNSTTTKLIALNVDGKLCFWFARQGYWAGYNVECYDVSRSTTYENLVTSIDNVVDPVGTKRVEIPLSQIYSSAQNNIGTGATNYAAGNHTHSSYASTITTTGTGNAITALSISGNTITATKGSSFLSTGGGTLNGRLYVRRNGTDAYTSFIDTSGTANEFVFGGRHTDSTEHYIRIGVNKLVFTSSQGGKNISLEGHTHSTLPSQVTFGDGNAFTILQNGGSWHQRIRTGDSGTVSDKRFIFDEVQGSGSWVELFSFDGQGNGYLKGTAISKSGHTHNTVDLCHDYNWKGGYGKLYAESRDPGSAGADSSGYTDSIHWGHNGGVKYKHILMVKHSDRSVLWHGTYLNSANTFTYYRIWTEHTFDPGSKLNVSGGTATGALSATSLGVTNTDSTTGKGLSLYGGATAGAPTYGLMFAGTATFGKHGGITSDWSTYLTMSDTTTRGWIFRRGSTNVASINGNGQLVLNSSATATSFVKSGVTDSAVLLGAGGHISYSTGGTASTIAARDSAGDLNCRLVRTTYGEQNTIGGGIVFRINSSSDNYLRVCNSQSAIRTWLSVPDTNHTHQTITSRGRIDGAAIPSTYPAGISMSEAYSASWPTSYGNVLTLKGGGDTQLFMEWSGSQTSSNNAITSNMYLRSRRDNLSAWSDFSRVCMFGQNIGTGASNYAAGNHTHNYAGSSSAGGVATKAYVSEQLEAFTANDFTGGGHYLKAIRYDGWHTKLYMGYHRDGTQQNTVHVGYADNATSATSAGSAGYADRLTIVDNRGADRAPDYYNIRQITAFFNEGIPNAFGTWASGITVRGWSTDYRVWQLFGYSSTGTSDELYFRSSLTNTTWQTARRIWHSGNFNPNRITGHTLIAADPTYGTTASISLAIGDTDTGFQWNGDGNILLKANNVTVANFYNNSFDVINRLKAGRIECGYEHGAANSIGCSNWFRSSGNTGWYNATHGGGIYMADGTWVSVYNGKKFSVNNTASDAIYTNGGISSNGFYKSGSSDRYLLTGGGGHEDVNKIPQLLLGGRIKYNMSTMTGACGRIPNPKGITVGWSTSRLGMGSFKVTHNIGHTDYTVFANPYWETGWNGAHMNCFVRIEELTATYVRLRVVNADNGNLVESCVMFGIFGTL